MQNWPKRLTTSEIQPRSFVIGRACSGRNAPNLMLSMRPRKRHNSLKHLMQHISWNKHEHEHLSGFLVKRLTLTNSGSLQRAIFGCGTCKRTPIVRAKRSTLKDEKCGYFISSLIMCIQQSCYQRSHLCNEPCRYLRIHLSALRMQVEVVAYASPIEMCNFEKICLRAATAFGASVVRLSSGCKTSCAVQLAR